MKYRLVKTVNVFKTDIILKIYLQSSQQDASNVNPPQSTDDTRLWIGNLDPRVNE